MAPGTDRALLTEGWITLTPLRFDFTDHAAMDDDFLKNRLAVKFWYIDPETAWRFKVNALNHMNNNFTPAFLPHIEKAMTDQHEKVREMAKWVWNKHAAPRAQAPAQ